MALLSVKLLKSCPVNDARLSDANIRGIPNVEKSFLLYLIVAKTENEFPMGCTSTHLLCARSNRYISSFMEDRARAIDTGAPTVDLLTVNSCTSLVSDAQFDVVLCQSVNPPNGRSVVRILAAAATSLTGDSRPNHFKNAQIEI